MTHNKIDELMPMAMRNGVAAALVVAQREGLIKFPVGLLSEEQIQYRIDLCVGAFLAAVQDLDPSHKP